VGFCVRGERGPWGPLPMGMIGLLMARIEAGLLLLDVDFGSSRFAWTDADRSTPVELGFGWWFRTLAEDDRAIIGRRAIEHELASESRWKLVGLTTDWKSWDDLHRRNGLEPAKDHTRRSTSRRSTTMKHGSAMQPASCTRQWFSATLPSHAFDQSSPPRGRQRTWRGHSITNGNP